MKASLKSDRRRVLGQVSKDTKGPPGTHMEASGLWDKPGLSA